MLIQRKKKKKAPLVHFPGQVIKMCFASHFCSLPCTQLQFPLFAPKPWPDTFLLRQHISTHTGFFIIKGSRVEQHTLGFHGLFLIT